MLIVCILTYLYLPETRGRSSAELDEMFALRIPARKFRSKYLWFLPMYTLMIRRLT